MRPENVTRYARNGMVCTIDHLASSAGVAMMRAGGSAADAAIAANAVLAVTSQHMCGMGGDLFAIVHDGDGAPHVLNASGRAGSGADPEALRAEGHAIMPFRDDIRSVPIPGCVDGWVELHRRFGRLPFEDLLAPAIDAAENGFPAAPLLVAAVQGILAVDGSDDYTNDGWLAAGDLVRRPGVARALQTVVIEGREGFYRGEFGEGLLKLGHGEYVEADLARGQADWVDPLGIDVWGHRVWTVPPNSQGYLDLAGAAIAADLDLPADEADPLWAHLLIEAARHAGFDRRAVLHEGADGEALLDPQLLHRRARSIDPQRAAALAETYRGGGTMYMTAVDSDRMGVSLIQSNAAGFGANIVVPGVGIFLHNRGIGFSLEPGHPAEYGPGRRPPHTLAPALVTRPDGSLRAVLGTMGGDAQPQIVLQMLARLLHHNSDVGHVVAGPRWVLATEGTGFDTWDDPDATKVVIEPDAPEGWLDGLTARGHRVERRRFNYGHAHAIEVDEGVLRGAADPRALTGGAVGY